MDQQVRRMIAEANVIKNNLVALDTTMREHLRQIRDAIARYEGQREDLLKLVSPELRAQLEDRVPTLKSLADGTLGDGYIRELARGEAEKAIAAVTGTRTYTMPDGSGGEEDVVFLVAKG